MKVLSFVNMKGGVGKSTLAINIAHCLAERRSQKVLVIDMDPQFNATQCLMDAENYINYKKLDKSTISSVFNEQQYSFSSVDGMQLANNEQKESFEFVEINDNLYLLPGDLSLYQVEMSPGEGKEFRLENFLETIDEDFDFIIIDTPPTPSIWMSSSLIASDYFIIVSKPEPLSVTGMNLLNSVIEYRKKNFRLKNLKCLGVALNLVEGTTLNHQQTIDELQKSDWSKLLFKTHIPKKTKIAKDQINGGHILSLNDSDLSVKLVKLTDEILTRIQSQEKS